MKIYLVWALACFWAFFPSCKSTAEQTNGRQTEIRGELSNCSADSILLFAVDGIAFKDIGAFPLEKGKDSTATFTIKAGKLATGFYFVGLNPADSRIVILGKDKKVTLKGDGANIKEAELTGSPSNEAYQVMKKRIAVFDGRFAALINEYRQAMGARQSPDAVAAKMGALDQEKLNYLDSLKAKDPFTATIAGMHTYISFQGYEVLGNQGKYANEPIYFGEQFLEYTNLADPIFNSYPPFLERVKAYAYTLGQINKDPAQQQQYVQKMLDSIPDGSGAERLALLGTTYGFERSSGQSFVHFGEMYLASYPNDPPDVRQNIGNAISRLKAKLPGAEAPEIALNTPEGKEFKLSDLRGKVVLIDFWASWCGPCRRENPSVVKVYNKYKDQGFEILSVSLDKDKNRWLQAIEKDGLTWYHVSDLKHWKSAAAQTYGVSSIPHTVLVDREGRIIANKLRGAALEQKLAEIFEGNN